VGAKQFKISFQLFNNSLKIAEVIFAANNHIKKRLLQSDPEVKDNFNNTLEQFSADEAEFLFDNEQPGTCLIRKSVTNDYRLVICILEIGKVEQWIIDPILLTYGLSNILSKYKFIKLNETHKYETCKIEDLHRRFEFTFDVNIEIEISAKMSFTIRKKGDTEVSDLVKTLPYTAHSTTKGGNCKKKGKTDGDKIILNNIPLEKEEAEHSNLQKKRKTDITIYNESDCEIESFTIEENTTFFDLLNNIFPEDNKHVLYCIKDGKHSTFLHTQLVVDFKDTKIYIKQKKNNIK